jgi:alpha-D-ribose 1-methylphosphonate 5-triphosphate diphosphatase PhnM
MTETVFTNARVITRAEEFAGSVVVRDGWIAEAAPGRSAVPGAIDLEGDYLVPGLVELHTDNLEKHFAPRPGVRWPSWAAVVAHDAQIAAAGITTVFDALALGDVFYGSARLEGLAEMHRGICRARDTGLLKADHHLHLRPMSLMQAPFVLAQAGIGLDVPAAIRLASYNPAHAMGLNDRGEIAAGKRADLARVRVVDDMPVVRSVWRDGARVV